MKTFLSVLLLLLVASGARAQAPADDLSSFGMKVAVTIIFDTSGSMEERGKLVMAKRAFGWWLESAPKDTIVTWSLWAFDPQHRNGVRLVDRKRDAATEVQQRIDRFVPSGGTPLGNTITQVRTVIDFENRKAEEGKADILRQVVLIFTDGKDSELKIPEVRKMVTKLRDAGAEVFSIGYQGEGDYLAEVSDRFIMVDDEKQLKSGLAEFSYFIEKTGPVKQP